MYVETTAVGPRPPALPAARPAADNLLSHALVGDALEVAFYWEGLPLDLRHLRPTDRPLRVGAASADFILPAEEVPLCARPFCRREAGQYVVCFSRRWTAVLEREGSARDLSALLGAGRAKPVDGDGVELILGAGERLLLDSGTLSFVISLSDSGRTLKPSWRDRVDGGLLGLVGLVGAGLGIVQAGLLAVPPSQTQVIEAEDAALTATLMRYAPPPPAPKATAPSGEGRKAKGKEGQLGEKKAQQRVAKGSPRPSAKEIAQESGILSALDDSADSRAVFGSSALSATLSEGVGGLIGAKGTQVGDGGLGRRKGGIGGGGVAEGPGGLGLNGGGRGRRGDRAGMDGGEGLKKTEGKLASGGEPIIVGALDASLIDAVVKRHQSQVRYCYQRALTRDPNLSGKVAVRFVIARDGTVSSAGVKSSSLGNSEVESCIADRFLVMQFPEPKGGGTVIVNYPFLFSAG